MTFKIADLIFKEQQNKPNQLDAGLDAYLGQGYVEAVNSEDMNDEEIPQMDDIESVNVGLDSSPSNKSMVEIEPEDGPEEEVKPLRPLAKIKYFTQEKVLDMKWVLNDTFMVVITQNEVMVFDALLQVIQIQDKNSEEPS